MVLEYKRELMDQILHFVGKYQCIMIEFVPTWTHYNITFNLSLIILWSMIRSFLSYDS
jgi:hypothetical protein